MFEYVGIAFMIFFILGIAEYPIVKILINDELLRITSSVISGAVAAAFAACAYQVFKG